MMEYSLEVDTTSDPGVPVHCIYSHNVQTFNWLKMSKNHDDSHHEDVGNTRFIMDDGDQTVDHSSLEVCDRWESTLKTYKVPGVAHSSMLNVEQVLDVIIAVATEDQATLDAWTPPKYSEILPRERAVSPGVLVKREGWCAICEDISELKPEATYLDPNTNKQTKCGDADNYCWNHDCGSEEERFKFFKENGCCTDAPFNPKLIRLQQKTE